MKDDDWRALVEASCEYLTGRQRELERSFRLGNYKRWDWSQDTGELVFSDASVPIVVATIQFVGSVSTRSNTWMWSWENRSIDAAVKSRVLDVRAFGETHGWDKLVTPCWHADEVDGWEMTSISAYLLKARGAYRTPDDRGFTYLILTDVRWFLSSVPRPG